MELEFIDEKLAYFYYYGKVVGLYGVNSRLCIVDELFEKNEIKKFFLDKNIQLDFKQDVTGKINEFMKN